MTKKKKCSSSSSSRSLKKVVGNGIVPQTSLSDRPDWLPDDWEMKLKRRSGSYRTDRYFVCPLSGRKFRSKWDVLGYLNDGVADSLEMEAPPSRPPLPLPPLRPRRSKHLQPTDQQSKNRRPKNRYSDSWRPKNRSTKSRRKLRDVPVIEHLEQVEDSPAGLPEGWIKETRLRRRGGKTDAYYIDPDHGYGFRSKVDVFRYLENNDLSRVVFILKRIHTPDACPLIDDSLPIAEFLKCTRKRSASKKRLLDGNELISHSVTPEKAAALSLKYASTKFDEGSSETACSTTTDLEYLEQYNLPFLAKQRHNPEMDGSKQCTEKHKKKCNSYTELNLQGCHEYTTNTTFQEAEKNCSMSPDKDSSEEPPSHSKTVKRKAEILSDADDLDDLIFNTDVGKRYAKLKSKQLERKKKAAEGKLSSLNHSVEAETSQKVHTTKPNESDTNVLEKVGSQKNLRLEEQHMDLAEKLSSIKLIDEAESSHKANVIEPKDLQRNEESADELKNIKLMVESASHGQIQVESFENVPIFVYSWSDPCLEFAFKTLSNEDADNGEENMRTQEKVENLEHMVEPEKQNSESSPSPYGFSWSDPCIDFAFRTLTSDFSSLEDAASIQDYLKHIDTSSICSNKNASVSLLRK